MGDYECREGKREGGMMFTGDSLGLSLVDCLWEVLVSRLLI